MEVAMITFLDSARLALISLIISLSIGIPVSSEAAQANVVLEKEKHFPIATKLLLKDIVVAAKLGLLDRHWDFRNESDSAVVASFGKKKYIVKIRLIVSNSKVTMQYIESRNLNYGTESGDYGEFAKEYPEGTYFIHPSYNRWLAALFSDIEVEIKRIMVKKGLM
jgi:hypothetical protein